ncbi:ATP-binding protein [Niallia circulans]|uniref:AAA family ATPase n=1 Tax=Niallia circulans TaxID=1397 RepID=A0A941GKX9_NIACI|nr:AAA family ATPase [Niallia circulans]MCB5239156.1 AAA family ATPase [Niallia circulans]
MTYKHRYPFTAIVGQENMKLAILLNIINPKIGGVLIKGEKGTAKSTAVRSISDLMDGLEVIDLPLSITEDRLLGTLDMEYAIKHGEKKFEPGILYYADNNILYVDEINLLDDSIIDSLLDVAAMGVNTIERDGISHSHSSRFILVGTMNPEEGEIRPQLLDRFGLSVDVFGEKSVKDRMLVIERRLAFENNPSAFIQQYHLEQTTLVEKIHIAREILKDIEIDSFIYQVVAELSIELGLESHRADITMIKTAMTIAAFDGRKQVQREDITRAAYLVLPHRLRQAPFDDSANNAFDQINMALSTISVVN